MRYIIYFIFKKVIVDLSEKFGFNIVILVFMELINDMYKYKELDNINEVVIKEGV